jgi:transcriptional regulator with XRE-family HTH domain
MRDFAHYSGIHKEHYREYELGTKLPTKVTLEKIIEGTCLTEEEAVLLRETRNEEKARRSGIDLRPAGSLKIDVSNLAEKIQKELEYELKRSTVTLSKRTRRVCIRRIEIILRDALGES